MGLEEPTSARTSGPAAALSEAIEAARQGDPENIPAPEFSGDGGVNIFDQWGRSARLQPLGERIRITLADQDGFVAESEVDSDTLVASIGAHRSAYDAIAEALDVENGPGRHSR